MVLNMTEKEIRNTLTRLGKESKNASDFLAKLQDYETEDLAKMILVIADTYAELDDKSEMQYTAGIQALMVGITISLRILRDEDEDEEDLYGNIV